MLLRKSSKFTWEEEQESAYQQLKAALLEPPILKYPDYSKTFIVVTDASQVGLRQQYTVLHNARHAAPHDHFCSKWSRTGGMRRAPADQICLDFLGE